MSKVLVTGGCGFVGRNLTRALLAGGVADLWIVDDLTTGLHPDTWLPPLLGGAEGTGTAPRVYARGGQRVTFLDADVVTLFGEAGSAAAAIPWPRFDEAYHLASVVGGRRKIEEEPLQIGIDLAIDSTFMLWAARGHAERVLYASSSAAYPIDVQTDTNAVALGEHLIALREQRIAMPDLTYGWSKLTGEYLAQLLVDRHDVPACVVRPFSGYGEDQELVYPIPAIARRAAGREDPLLVWGTGRQGRDFIHIDDCVEAMRIAIRTIEDGSAVNLGSGTLTTFLEVAALFAQLADYQPEITGTQEGPVGVHARYADTRLMRERLGWKPTISMEEGFARVLAAQERRLAAAVSVAS